MQAGRLPVGYKSTSFYTDPPLGLSLSLYVHAFIQLLKGPSQDT